MKEPSPTKSDDGIGRSLSADELDSGAALQPKRKTKQTSPPKARIVVGSSGKASSNLSRTGIVPGEVPNGIHNVVSIGKRPKPANGDVSPTVVDSISTVVSASTSALPPRHTFAGSTRKGKQDDIRVNGASNSKYVRADGAGRHTVRGVGEVIDEEKEGGLWKRLRSKFKAKARDARGSFRLDRGTFAKLVSRRNTNEGTGAGSSGTGRERGYKRREKGISASSASLRRQMFMESTEDDGSEVSGKKKGKRRKSDKGSRFSKLGLPKRVFSSPPNLSGRSNGRRGRFSSLSRSSGVVDEAESSPSLRTPKSYRSPLVGSNVQALVDITSSSVTLTGRLRSKEVAPEKNAATFRRVLEDTIASRKTFRELLDCMFVLEERLPTDIKETLIKFLSKQDHMETLIKMLTMIVPNTPNDPVVKAEGAMSGPERARYRYSYISSMLLSNGPIQLRRILFLNTNYMDMLVNILGVDTPKDRVVASSVCKVLLSTLRDSPEDSVQAMARRKDFMPALLSHISVTGTPEVCLSMLSTVRCQADLKFGAPNKPVVGMMAEARVQETLCKRLAIAAESGPINGERSATIENCSRCIVGIALRALVIPKFELNNDDADAEYMTDFNEKLARLDLFQNPEPLMHLVDVGLRSIKNHDTRGYGLATALTAIRYILVTAINAQDSSMSAIRMQVLKVSTTLYEESIARRIPQLAQVLLSARKDATVVTMWDSVHSPLGVVRLKILELLLVLQLHGRPRVSQIMVESNIPTIVMSLFKRLRLNSLCLHIAATMVEQSFRCQHGAMRRALLIDNHLIDEVMHLWELGNRKEANRAKTPVADQGELLRMIVSIRDFMKQTVTEVQKLKKEIGLDKIAAFSRFCEGEIAERIGLHSRLLGGVEQLPARNDEVSSFEDMPGFGGSEGALYFRGRSGAAAPVLTAPVA